MVQRIDDVLAACGKKHFFYGGLTMDVLEIKKSAISE